jgi:hypothetical protein
MRTTLTLDADVVRMIQDEVHRQRKPFKQVVNDALRRALSHRSGAGPRPRTYRVHVHDAKLLPGLDPGRLNALAEDLETQARVLPSHSRVSETRPRRKRAR